MKSILKEIILKAYLIIIWHKIPYALSNFYSIIIYHNIIFISSKYNFLYQKILTLIWNENECDILEKFTRKDIKNLSSIKFRRFFPTVTPWIFRYLYHTLLYHTSFAKELIEYSHKDRRSVSVEVTRSVWPRTCWSKGNDKGRSARRKNTRLERPPAERATRIAFAVGYRPSRSLIAREFGFTARSFSATFISSVLRLLVRVARPSTPCTVHRRLMIPSEWEIDH